LGLVTAQGVAEYEQIRLFRLKTSYGVVGTGENRRPLLIQNRRAGRLQPIVVSYNKDAAFHIASIL
jgi:hypothetical protein